MNFLLKQVTYLCLGHCNVKIFVLDVIPSGVGYSIYSRQPLAESALMLCCIKYLCEEYPLYAWLNITNVAYLESRSETRLWPGRAIRATCLRTLESLHNIMDEQAHSFSFLPLMFLVS